MLWVEYLGTWALKIAEEVVEDFEAARSNGKFDQVERPRGGRIDQLVRPIC